MAFFCVYFKELNCYDFFMEETDIEIIVHGEVAFFTWNTEAIQALAEELGETDFPEPRPCG